MFKYIINKRFCSELKDNFNLFWYFKKNEADNFIDDIKIVKDPSTTFYGFFDGCSKGNPGKSGCGWVIYDFDNKKVFQNSYFLGIGTNNRAEYLGLAFLLYSGYLLGIKNMIICGDSNLVIKQMNKEYKVKDSKLYHIHTLCSQLKTDFYQDLTFKHIRREMNGHADKLSRKSIF